MPLSTIYFCSIRLVSFIGGGNFYLFVQSMPITTKVLSSNPAHGKMYSIQHYVIKFVGDLRKVGGFLWVLQFPPPIKLTAMIYWI
jgi:hypothetical protein